MSLDQAKSTAPTKSLYVSPEIVDYGDGREATKGAGGAPAAADAAPPYQS